MYTCRYDESVVELKKVHQQTADSQRRADVAGKDRERIHNMQLIQGKPAVNAGLNRCLNINFCTIGSTLHNSVVQQSYFLLPRSK